MNITDIISETMYLINNTIDELIYFVPDVLKIFALSLFMIMLNFALLKNPTKKRKIISIVIGLFYGIYCIFRLIPIDKFDFSLSIDNFQEIFVIIMSLLPYFCMIFVGKKIKEVKIVNFFLNYHMLHLLFLLIAITWNNFDSESVSLVATIVFIMFTYTFSLANYKSGAK